MMEEIKQLGDWIDKLDDPDKAVVEALRNAYRIGTKTGVEQVYDILEDYETSPRGNLWYCCDNQKCQFGVFPDEYLGDQGDDCPEEHCDGTVVRTRLIVEHDLREQMGDIDE